MPWDRALAIALGAAVGANLRYFIGHWLNRADFPWGTFAVNAAGSFLIGLFAVMAVRQHWDHRLFGLLVVGGLGGFTTFSAFSGENLEMLQKGRFDLFALNAFGSVLLGLVLAWGGYSLAHKLV